MERRQFLSGCALLGGAASMVPLADWQGARAQEAPRVYARTRLIDVHGRPIQPGQLALETNYVFHYPYAATPCLLLKLARPVAAPAALKRQDGSEYAWRGDHGQWNGTPVGPPLQLAVCTANGQLRRDPAVQQHRPIAPQRPHQLGHLWHGGSPWQTSRNATSTHESRQGDNDRSVGEHP